MPCFLGVMKPGRSKPHRACAVRCISGGIPPFKVPGHARGGVPFGKLHRLRQRIGGKLIGQARLQRLCGVQTARVPCQPPCVRGAEAAGQSHRQTPIGRKPYARKGKREDRILPGHYLIAEQRQPDTRSGGVA